MPLFPIRSHFLPPGGDIGSDGVASQKNFWNFPFADRDLAVRISRVAAALGGVSIQISELAPLVDVPAHA
jgi:hypothetical protein